MKSISEVIYMMGKGFQPEHKFSFHGDIYEGGYYGVIGKQYFIADENINDPTNIVFHFDLSGNELEYVELRQYLHDKFKRFKIYDKKWSPKKIKDAYYNFGLMF